jgi:hypothetical protein
MSRTRIFFYVCALSLVAAYGTYLAVPGPRAQTSKTTNFRPRPEEFGLVVAAKYLDFGEAWEDLHFQWTVPVENKSNKKIHIEKMATSCDCVATEVSNVLIPVGETRKITFTLDLSASPVKATNFSRPKFPFMVSSDGSNGIG